MSERIRKLKDKASRAHGDGKWKSALEVYERILEEEPGEVACRLKIGEIHRRLGNTTEAVAAFQIVARAYADDGLLLKAIAVCKMILGVDAMHAPTHAMLDALSTTRHGSERGPRARERPTAPAMDATPLADAGLLRPSREEPRAPHAMVPIPRAVSSLWPSAPQRATAASDHSAPVLGETSATDFDLVIDEAPPEFHIPLFSDLPRNAFLELLEKMRMRELERGEHVIRQGEVGDSFFVLVTGRVRVVRKDDEGHDTILARLSDGAFFGEMALLQDGARTASVIVDEPSQIFEIRGAVLDEVVAEYPSVAAVLRKFYAERLIATAMASHPIFRAFDASERSRLGAEFEARSVAAGSVLLREGERGAAFYLVLHGRLHATSVREDEEVVLGTLGPGDVFGEMSLLTNRPISATVTAISDSFLLCLSKAKFDELIMTHPSILELVSSVSEERGTANASLLAPAHAAEIDIVLV